ncbi:hypothetical protein OG762_39130 [Streptomyces sp. NBC_01136]|uniref:hypothetical protein n=1 Tax=unclassified Streptomyces TaxID=2593676 RepID=UPI003244E420|nr:hypothetical protein OG762_39130 [Streptomyces sp. NBC_01136]
MSAEERRTWVALGGVHLLNGTTARDPEDPLLLVRVPPQEITVPSTTVVVRWADLGTCDVQALTSAGTPLGRTTVRGPDLFPRGLAGPALRSLADAGGPALVPLCYLAEEPGGGFHAYAQIRSYADDACFVRTTAEPVGSGAVTQLYWLEPVLASFRRFDLQLGNHLLYFRNHHAGTELEFKYTLDPAPDIWTAAMEVLGSLHAGELPGCRPEYREEFQIWTYDNHLFDVLAPEDARGYASFIPTTDGKHMLKRKWFAEDSFARREEHTHGVDVTAEGFAAHLADALGLQSRAMPPFRRIRYDVQCESMRTGHIYGIFFDHCSLLDAPDVVLSQCEVEYLRSRNLLDHPAGEVTEEMERIGAWLDGYLADRGWAKERSFYSKRSFLRDVVAARPDLVPAP